MSNLIISKASLPTSAECLQAGFGDDSWTVERILDENRRRMDQINAVFDPFTGLNSIGPRQQVKIRDFPIPDMWLPESMLEIPMVEKMANLGLYGFINKSFKVSRKHGDFASAYAPYVQAVLDTFCRLRNRYDFAWWCWQLVPIARKGGGDDIRFRLNLPQRKYINLWEQMERDRRPVRIDLLKARQWGGSTVTQIKFGHHQLVCTRGANSIIVGHVKDASTEVKDMYFKLINKYPTELLYEPNQPFNPKLPPIHGTSSSANLFYIDSRNCKLKLGSAERPESARGGDSTLAHCTEVAMWVATEGKSPEDIVRSVTGGISYKPGTVIVYESTANGTDNFFHDEYTAARQAKDHGHSHQFEPLFISWFEIGWKNMLPFKDDIQYLKKNQIYKEGSPRFDIYLPDEIAADAPMSYDFAERLLALRRQQTADSDRQEPGRYLWWLWEIGAPLEAIYWYTIERTKFHAHADIAAEAPSDDIEAFKHSGQKVFSEYHVHQLEASCKPPAFIGEVESTLTVNAEDFKRYAHRPNDKFRGSEILSNLDFRDDESGSLWIWDKPEYFTDCKIKNRYLVVVDVGGVSNRSDYSVVCVFDRYWMIEGGRPAVVAQWYGHIDHDVLAWKAAQIAKYYDNAMLVIESNTLEVRDRDRDVDGDQSQFILNQIKESYPNLYSRVESEEAVLNGIPRRYGFHTNVQTKPMIIANLRKCIRDALYVERDKRCLHEFLVYVKLPNNAYAASKGHHDDLLMTRAIGLHICYNEMEMPYVISNDRHRISYQRQQSISSAII